MSTPEMKSCLLGLDQSSDGAVSIANYSPATPVQQVVRVEANIGISTAVEARLVSEVRLPDEVKEELVALFSRQLIDKLEQVASFTITRRQSSPTITIEASICMSPPRRIA